MIATTRKLVVPVGLRGPHRWARTYYDRYQDFFRGAHQAHHWPTFPREKTTHTQILKTCVCVVSFFIGRLFLVVPVGLVGHYPTIPYIYGYLHGTTYGPTRPTWRVV